MKRLVWILATMLGPVACVVLAGCAADRSDQHATANAYTDPGACADQQSHCAADADSGCDTHADGCGDEHSCAHSDAGSDAAFHLNVAAHADR